VPSSVRRDDASCPAAESQSLFSEFAFARSRSTVALKSVLCWRIRARIVGEAALFAAK